MTSALRFRLPVQGEGIQETGIGVEWSHVYGLAGDANGYPKWSRQKNYTGFTHDTEYLMRLRNRGSGGKHQIWEKSTDGSTIATMTDTGLALTALTASGQITSTVATGTAPLVVASTTKVTNLNADLLDGHDSSFFASQTDLDDYLPLTGGVLSGDLELENLEVNGDGSIDGSLVVNVDLAVDGDFDVDGDSDLQVVRLTPDPATTTALFIRYGATRGYWSVGATDVTNTDLIFKDPNGVETVRIGHASNPNSLEVASGNALFGVSIQVNDSATINNDLHVLSNTTLDGLCDVLSDMTVGGTMNISGATVISDTLRVTQVARFDQGSGAGFSQDSWDGYILMSHNGNEVEVPYVTH
jgi:hypothetical protein